MFWVVGFFAFLWVLLRTGTNPKRLAYPCQQAAFPLAASWLLAVSALVGGTVLWRKLVRHSRVLALSAVLIWVIVSLPGSPKADVIIPDTLPIWEVENPISKIFVMNQIPPTSGSLAAGDTSVPDIHLSDPAIDSLLAIMQTQGIYLHKTAVNQTGIMGADDIVIIKGNFQWTSRNTTSTDRIKGLVWQILQHPDGFAGEIIICDNTQNIGTGINHGDNNSEDTDQSIVDVVNTFFAKGYPVYYRDWSNLWDVVVAEYSEGDTTDGYPYEETTKITYPKFRVPSGNYYVSLRYGIWDPSASEYDKSRLTIVDFPVLKAHVMAGATVAVKNWIGVLTTAYQTSRYMGFQNMHYSHFWGPSSLVAKTMEVTFPKLVIVDAAWVSGYNPNVLRDLVNTKMLLGSTDPVAVSWYAAKYILTSLVTNPDAHPDPDAPIDPASDHHGEYSYVLGNWTAYFQSAGIVCTKDASEISVYDRTSLPHYSIDERGEASPPTNFQLLSNYPNPFNPNTIIRYDLPERTLVRLAIYDQLGREVVVLKNDDLQASQHESIWDGRDANGRSVPSGIYITRLVTPTYTTSIKMLLLK
jgi:hypothetical protein